MKQAVPEAVVHNRQPSRLDRGQMEYKTRKLLCLMLFSCDSELSPSLHNYLYTLFWCLDLWEHIENKKTQSRQFL